MSNSTRFIVLFLAVIATLILGVCRMVQMPASGIASADPPHIGALSGFVDNNGIRIHYEVEGQGPPLVLMHWWTGSSQDWRLFGYTDALKDHYRLILIDARGHGQSDKPHDPADYALEKQVGDVTTVLDKLKIDKAHYFGYSMGATIGWAAAKYAPDRFMSLIIGGDAPAGYNPSGSIGNIRSLGNEGFAQMVVDVTAGYGFSLTQVYAAYAATDIDAVVADVKAFSAESFGSDLPGMTMPILLLAGTQDEDYGGLMIAAEKLPNARLEVLPGFDHSEAFLQTGQIVEYITKFLSGVTR